MPRITKAPEERRQEIIDTAARLFHEIGYEACSVDRIIREIGVAKGTFYYYFRSKEEILGAIVDRTLDGIVAMATAVADNPDLTALAKFQALLTDSHVGEADTQEIAGILHLPENRQLHEVSNVESVRRLSPIFARIVDQGNREGVFAADRPLETIQFLFVGTQFLLDGGLFTFTPPEIRARREVAQRIVERALGATPGSFAFMNPHSETPP